jgi:hypothetical protein
MMSALSTAADRVRSGQADDAITRWFGAATLAERAGLAGTISKFRANINLKKIVVGFEIMKKNPAYNQAAWDTYKVDKAAWKANPIGPAPAEPASLLTRDGANAAAYAAPDQNVSLNLGDMLSHVPRREGEVPVELGTNFRSLPMYLPMFPDGTVDNTGWNQSQLDTLVHELSHLLLGTKDKTLANGKEAYGAKRASKLALESPQRALKNAENWGIFIEAAGYHRSS